MKKNFILLVIFILLPVVSCRRDTQPLAQTKIAVTNSYFECAVRDLCDDVTVVCLTPPGMCPGHFDILPSSVEQLRESRLLLRFEFQSGMDGQMRRFQENGLRIEEIVSRPGLCIPESYVAICDEICRVLCVYYPEKQGRLEHRMQEIRRRMTTLERTVSETLHNAGLEQCDVVCSMHQAEFAKSLGLNVVSTFLGRDMATPANMGQCLAAAQNKQIQFVIANKQEGTELAKALADRLHARLVVFSNFPDTGGETACFDAMILDNINQLRADGTL